MNTYRYPMKEHVSDYLRSGAGFFVPIALMLFADLSPVVSYIMSALALLFGVYGLRTALRQATVIIVDGDGVRQEGPLGGFFDRNVGWAEMRDFRLRYYSTRRDGRDGWMQLVLRGTQGASSQGARGPIRLDSHLSGFDDIVRGVHDAARNHGLAIDPTSATNLGAMGLGDGAPAAGTADPALPS